MRDHNSMLRILALVASLVVSLSACTNLPTSTSASSDATTGAPVSTDSPTPANATDAKAVTGTTDTATPPKDLWQRIRTGFTIPEPETSLVARHEKWFARNPEYISRMTNRARLYLYYIVDEVERRKMPMEIALLPAIESSYKPHAYSRARAAGLWQFIPSTGRHYGLHNDWWYDGRRDVISATHAALDYLQSLADNFDGNWHLALASYNAGERRVRGAQRYNQKRGRDDRYEKLSSLKPETRNYVPKLIAFSKIVANPEKYGIKLDPIPNEPYFAEVETGSQIDLGVAAKLADIPLGDLYDINPGHKRWATSPTGPHRLLVPADKKDDLIAALSNLPEDQRVRWQRHYVRQGDVLGTIARRYGVSVRSIRQANRLRGNRIRAGSSLLIPVSSRRLSQHYANVTKPVKRKPAAPPKGTVAVIHEIKSGETLWSISQQYNVYMRQLARWNAIGTRSTLRPGQKLKIWLKPSQVPDSDATQENAKVDTGDSPA